MNDDSKKKILQIIQNLKSFFLTKNALSFIAFLLLSSLFWFINFLNKERDLSFSIPVVYTDIPQNIMFEESLPQEIRLKVKDLGINLLTYIKSSPKPVKIMFKQGDSESGHFNVSYLQLMTAVSESLLPTSSILLVNPENISSNYNRLYAKILPVRLNSKISLEDQYMLCEPIQVIPETIEVFGPKQVLDSLTELHTEKLEIKNLHDSITCSVIIKPHKFVSYSTSKITVNASAEMFTEKTENLPVQIINNPVNMNILSFPAEVKAVFNISVKKYNFFKQSDIHVFVDYNEIKKVNATKQKLKVINNKPYISNIRIQPDEVEFLLEAN